MHSTEILSIAVAGSDTCGFLNLCQYNPSKVQSWHWHFKVQRSYGEEVRTERVD